MLIGSHKVRNKEAAYVTTLVGKHSLRYKITVMNEWNNIVSAVALTVTVLASSPALAVDAGKAKQLMQANACMGCHAVDRKLVGPAFKAVADKYKGGDVATLAASIRAGGAGKWGPIPMPAQGRLTPADATLLAEWILAGAPN